MLKNKPYTRIRLIKIIEGIFMFLGFFITPITFFFKKSINKNPNFWKWFLGFYWFTNKDETLLVDNWYGIYQIYGRDYVGFDRKNIFFKYWYYYRWNALRNPHWNLKKVLGIGTIGEIDNNKVHEIVFINLFPKEHENIIWRNKKFHGEQHIEFPKGDYKHFRKSVTRPLKKLSPMKWLGYTHINKMLGCGEDRYISKLRIFKYIPRKITAEEYFNNSRFVTSDLLITGERTLGLNTKMLFELMEEFSKNNII